MATVIASRAVNFDQLDVSGLDGAPLYAATSTAVSFGDASVYVTFTGSFSYSKGAVTGGVVTGYSETVGGQVGVEFTGVNVSMQSILQWARAGDNLAVRNAFMGGNDLVQGSFEGDFLRSYGGDDTIFGGGADDSIEGGQGNDYLRGEDGGDWLYGSEGFDDINGNKGHDVASGGPGDDWVVGGQDHDRLYGAEGYDIVLGNLGNDTLYGEDGNDTLRGGQDNDVLEGGAGDDWLSGDRGDDTRIIGGLGADTFHAFYGCNRDVVIDFNRAQGDRVQIDPGTAYTVQEHTSFSVRVDMGDGHFLILENVTLASLTGDWIFVG